MSLAAPAPRPVPDSASAGPSITLVEAIPYVLPYRAPARFASGAITRGDHVLVRVHDETGAVGQAEAQARPYTYGETQASIVSAVRDHLGPALVGRDLADPAALRWGGTELPGNVVARGALDLAVWDLAGIQRERPCHAMLGGDGAPVRVAHMLSFGTPDEMAAEAVAIRGRFGVTSFKVKVGRDVDLDVAAVTAVRQAVPDAELYVDANRGWTYPQAEQAGDRLIGLDVRSIEEPLPLDDADGRRRLAERWSVPLVGDESCIGLVETERALDAGAVRSVSIKTARTGFSESLRIRALCVERGVPAVIGSQYEGGVGAWATVAFAAASGATIDRPAEVTNFADLSDDIVVAPPVVADGLTTPTDRAGIGAEVDESALERYRVDR